MKVLHLFSYKFGTVPVFMFLTLIFVDLRNKPHQPNPLASKADVQRKVD